MTNDDETRFATRSIHGGDYGSETGDVTVPIHLSSTFEQEAVPVDVAFEELDPNAGEYLYTRLNNPTRNALERRLASVCGGETAFALSSGTAAVLTTVLATVRPGEEIVAFEDLYGGSLKLLEQLARDRLGMTVTFVDARTPHAVESAISADTALILMESPTNPLMRLCDLGAIADIADAHDVPLAVDNTFASPAFQHPLELGADLEIHSTTKYLNGHSDGLGGAIVTDDAALAEEIGFLQQVGMGNPLSPSDAYLVLRGMKTLNARMAHHERNALEVARFLEAHRHVAEVNYPGLERHPQHDLAARQMSGYSGVLSFELDGTAGDARAFLEALETFSLAVSLGGVESLIELPAAMTHQSIDPDVREARGITDTLVRASIGIEDAADLKADLERGFEAAFGGNT